MTAITTRGEIIDRQLQGRGVNIPFVTTANGTLTAAAAASGFFSNSLHFNLIGTTLPTTLVGLQLPPGTQDLRCVNLKAALPAAKSGWLGWLYQFGTLNFASTGNGFTHDSTFTELRRTQFGEASKPITMIPLIYIQQNVVAGTAPAMSFSYADQDGNATTGSVTLTFPSTNTAVQSCFNLMLNDEDCAVQDVTAFNITQGAGSSPATAKIFGFEHIATVHSTVLGELSYDDQVYSPTLLKSLRPAAPNSGSVTSYLAFMCPANLGTVGGNFVLSGVDNT